MTRVLGLTGSFGSGKSTIGGIFGEAGIPVLDADIVARDVVRLGQPALGEIVDTFGDEVLAEEGSLDRKKMANIVFNDSRARARLNAIIHPRVREEMARFIHDNKSAPLVVLEIPLLLESNDRFDVDDVIVVTASERKRFMRLKGKGFGEKEVIARLGGQMAQARKAAMADWVIDNDGGLDQARVQVHEIMRRCAKNSNNDRSD